MLAPAHAQIQADVPQQKTDLAVCFGRHNEAYLQRIVSRKEKLSQQSCASRQACGEAWSRHGWQGRWLVWLWELTTLEPPI